MEYVAEINKLSKILKNKNSAINVMKWGSETTLSISNGRKWRHFKGDNIETLINLCKKLITR